MVAYFVAVVVGGGGGGDGGWLVGCSCRSRRGQRRTGMFSRVMLLWLRLSDAHAQKNRDYLLDEMALMANDFREERKWKMEKAKKLAYAAKKYLPSVSRPLVFGSPSSRGGVACEGVWIRERWFCKRKKRTTKPRSHPNPRFLSSSLVISQRSCVFSSRKLRRIASIVAKDVKKVLYYLACVCGQH